MKARPCFIVVIFLFMLWVIPVMAQTNGRDVSYTYNPYNSGITAIPLMGLTGLKGISVSIMLKPTELEPLALTRDQIKTEVERRLRKAGVKILTEKECSETPGSPILCVIVHWTTFNAIYAVYDVQLKLTEDVKLLGQEQQTVPFRADIWSMGCFGTVRLANMRKIQEEVGDRVNEFINYYLQVNPK